MTVTATGNFAKTLAAMKALIAASETFQAEVGLDTSGFLDLANLAQPAPPFDTEDRSLASAAFVFIGECNKGTGNVLPDCFAVIETEPGSSARQIGTGTFLNNGSLAVIFERAIPSGYQAAESEPDAILDFHNWLDAVIDECQTLSGQAGYLITRSWDITTGPQRFANEHRMFARVAVGWGLNG